jgi:polysaccharide pyruvyl transferase CsaB
MATVLFSGYYGYNNIGDEAVLGGLLAGLRAADAGVTPVVLSGDPAATEALHGVAARPRMGFGAVQAALRKADLLVSGGGSLLQDVTSLRSPLYYLGVLGLAQRAGVPTAAIAQGMGPLRAPWNRALARHVLDATRVISVRDEASAAFLHDIGVTRPPIEITADPAFLLAPEETPRLAEWWDAHIPADRPVIGVALRRWPHHNPPARYTAIADGLAALAAETGAFLLFVPMQYADDLPVSVQMAGWTPAESRVLDVPLTPRETLAVVGRCGCIVAMRLHTLIFAAARGVPALGIAYDPKVLDFALSADLPLPPRWEHLTTDEFTANLRAVWAAREAIARGVAARAGTLTARARRNIAIILDVLAGKELT